MNAAPPVLRGLHRHPAAAAPAGLALRAGIALAAGDAWPGARALVVRYELADAGASIAWPAPTPAPARLDKLWERTCCELFVHPDEGPAYLEFNFSPTGDWATYAFAGYRERLADPPMAAPGIRAAHGAARAAGAGAWLEVRLELPVPLGEGARFGLSAVLARADDASVSYWALAHPRPSPDFHDEAGHVLTLRALAAGAP